MDPLNLEHAWSESVAAAAKALWNLELGDKHRPVVEAPQDLKFGDATSGVAMRLAKELKQPPPKIAEALRAKLAELKPAGVAEIKATGGYINFTADRSVAGAVVRAAQQKPADWGRSTIGAGEKVLVEHVSANPTGPLHIAHARNGAIGDSVIRILKFTGHAAGAEFYVNDTGNQIENLGKSIWWRTCELAGKSYAIDLTNAYQGQYVKDLAAAFAKTPDASAPEADAIRRAAVFGKERLLADIVKDLKDFRIEFDTWSSQEELEAGGAVAQFVELLRTKGLTYEKDGALYVKSKELGHTQDEVLRKTDGNFTYRTPDTAYHLDKYARGWTRLVDLWGPDHHAHIGYMTHILKALGHEGFKVLIVQICHLFRNGEEVKFSKRTGNIYTLRELMDEVGVDAARFLFAMRKTDSPFDFDIEVLKKQTMDNPVWYVSYAHARICSIVAKGVEMKRVDAAEVKNGVWTGAFDDAALGDDEILVLRHVRQFRRAVERAARDLDPSTICTYLNTLSGAYQAYYQAGAKDASKRVLCDDEKVRRARLAVGSAVQVTIRNGLDLLGVKAPERLSSVDDA